MTPDIAKHSPTAEGRGYTEQLLFVNRGRYEYVAATLTLPAPAGEPLPPVVLMCHGFTGTRIEARRHFVNLSRLLAAGGVASLRFDYRGGGESSGTFDMYTFDDYVADAAAVFEWVTSCGSVDADRIGVLGFSLGGTVASYVVGRYADRIRALTLWAPVADPRDLIRSFYSPLLDLDSALSGEHDQETLDLGGYPIAYRFLRVLWDAEPLKEIRAVACPVLICHARDDETVNPSHTEFYHKVLGEMQKNVEICWVKQSNHTFASVEYGTRILNKTAVWFATNLRNPHSKGKYA